VVLLTPHLSVQSLCQKLTKSTLANPAAELDGIGAGIMGRNLLGSAKIKTASFQSSLCKSLTLGVPPFGAPVRRTYAKNRSQ
jgi:hypothetical protein